MTHEDFDTLVSRLEAGIGRNPKALHRRVFALAILGYAGLLAPMFFVVVLSLAFIVPGIVWAEEVWGLIIVGGVLLAFGGWAAGRTLWVRMDAPEGYAVTATTAPVLFELIQDCRKRLHSAPFYKVLVIAQCNAAVVYRPRLGVFGWHRNYLLLGLPMLEGFSREEVTAIVAHEFQHLARGHQRSGRWIYRLRRSWEEVFKSYSRPRVHGEVSFRVVTQKFIQWFWPRFNAHAFVLSRQHEYEADAAAAQVAGPKAAANALIRIGWYGRVLENKFWPDLWKMTASLATPPDDVFLRVNRFVRGIGGPGDARWLEQEWRSTTTNADTHPCLTDRLRAIGWAAGNAAAPASPGVTAAEQLLGASLPEVRAGVQALWRKQCEEGWRQMHGKAGVLQHRLEQFERNPAAQRENVDALWDKARVMLELRQKESAEVLLRQIVEADPRHAAANFNLGILLLDAGNAEGEACVERAIEVEEEILPRAADVLHAHYARTGRADRIKELYARLDQFEKSVTASGQERSNITAGDRFLGHGLTAGELQALEACLAADAEVTGAWLAQKELKYFVRQKLFVLCVRVRPAWHRLPSRDRDQAVVNRLVKAVRLPGRVFIFAPSGGYRLLARRVRKVEGARVFLGVNE